MLSISLQQSGVSLLGCMRGKIDTETEGSTGFRNPRAPGLWHPEGANKGLRVSKPSRAHWLKCLTNLDLPLVHVGSMLSSRIYWLPLPLRC